MTVPVQRLIERDRQDRDCAVSISGLEEGVLRLLNGRRGTALTRDEIGEVFKAGVVGHDVDKDLRELGLTILRAFSPQIHQAVKSGSDALDGALTNLVRRGAVRMTLVNLRAHFWTPMDS